MSGIGPQNGVPGDTTRMKRGCLTGMLILCMLITGLTYMTYQAYNAVQPPTELKPYMRSTTFLPFLTTKTPAPPATARLTARDVAFYIGALDSIDAGWRHFSVPYDSARAAQSQQGKKPEAFNAMDVDELGKIYWTTHLHMRRSLVPYLNLHGRSWEEYRWTKRRVIAASDITREEVADTARSFMKRLGFDMGDEPEVFASTLFDEVEKMRATGIDSAERALVAPHRAVLLTKGIHSLTETEEMFAEEE